MKRALLFFAIQWATLSFCPISAVLGQDSSDLEEYLKQVRDTGMSEMGRGDIHWVASLISGERILDFLKDDTSDRLWPRYTSATCPNPNADPLQEAQRQRRLNTERQALVAQLKPFADSDSSGFVSTAEGSSFRNLVEFGYLAAHVVKTGEPTVKAIAKASGFNETEVSGKLSQYQELANLLAGASIKPLPEVRVK